MIWRGMKILSIFWGGGNKIGLVLGPGHFYAILDPVLSSMYKIQNGDSLGVAKISFLFIYLSLN